MSVTPPLASAPLLEVSDLTVEFDVGRNRPPVRAVDGVSLTVASRETVGVIGESGSGKTTLGRAVLGLTNIKRGRIAFAGVDITRVGHRQRRQLGADLHVVFQDPYSSLNPTRTVGQTLAETLRVGGDLNAGSVDPRVQEMLERVGLPAEAARRYPAHFSGGQRQRIAIARALIAKPRLVVCDEPVSALDLSVQAQVLNLLRELQEEFGIAYLFTGHDLDVVRYLSHRVIVLYRGRVMEEGDANHVYHTPAHPYTRALIDAAPVPDPEVQQQRRRARPRWIADRGMTAPANACSFAPRCPYAIELCETQQPLLEPVQGGSWVSCHRWRELRARTDELTSTPAPAPTSLRRASLD